MFKKLADAVTVWLSKPTILIVNFSPLFAEIENSPATFELVPVLAFFISKLPPLI